MTTKNTSVRPHDGELDRLDQHHPEREEDQTKSTTSEHQNADRRQPRFSPRHHGRPEKAAPRTRTTSSKTTPRNSTVRPEPTSPPRRWRQGTKGPRAGRHLRRHSPAQSTKRRAPIGIATEDHTKKGKERQHHYSTAPPPPPPRQRHRETLPYYLHASGTNPRSPTLQPPQRQPEREGNHRSTIGGDREREELPFRLSLL